MKLSCKLLIIGALMLFCGIQWAPAQERSLSELNNEVTQAEEEIRRTNELLSKNKKQQQTTNGELRLIQRNITNRKKIISNLDSQSNVISKQIKSKNSDIEELQQQIITLKKEYGEMLYSAYINHKLNNFMLFLFSSKDFNEVTRRIAYMRSYNAMRERKVAEIDSLTLTMGVQVKELESKDTELGRVKESRTKELSSLSKDESKYKSSSASLKAQEGKLATTLKEKQNQLNKLQQQIQRIIAEEARKNKVASGELTEAESQYLIALTGRFDENKGKLPYPVYGGVIVDNYGVHPHPTQAGLMVNNKGVNIAAEKGASVRAVFEGQVSRVFFFQGLNNSVMIRHGNYLSVYSNLEVVNVKQGDVIALNQLLGKLSKGDNDEGWVLHFEIWQETTNLNPEEWLRK